MPANKSNLVNMVALAIGQTDVIPKEEIEIARPSDVFQHQEDTFEVERSAFGEERFVPRYEHKPNHPPFTATDFQIGSVRLETPPIAVGVERLRDISVTTVIRGQAIASKASASIVQITLTLDYPYPELVDSELKPLLAELKTCPFTKIRSYDMAIKLSGIEGFKVSDAERDSQLNVIAAESAKAHILSTLGAIKFRKDSDEYINVPSIENKISFFAATLLGNIVDGKTSKDAGKLADEFIKEIKSILNDKTLRDILEDNQATTYHDKHILPQWNDQENLQAKNKVLTRQFKTLLDAVSSEEVLNRDAREANIEMPLMEGFIPVVCQQVAMSSIPGRAGAFRVNFVFEYFFHDNYVDKLQYHSFDERVGWTETEDPAEADLLLRWRDIQYLGTEGYSPPTTTVDGLPLPVPTAKQTMENTLDDLNGLDDRGNPGFITRMQDARFSRVCRTFPNDSRSHFLNIYYPQSMPQIAKRALDVNTNAVYRGIIVDNADADADGITCNTQVMWNFNVARHVDEHNGIVRHQWAGGASLSASFELCIPHDGIPEDIINGSSVLFSQDPESVETNSYARLVGRINNMFATMERNRKFLPSDAFVPTSIFVDNPMTALFGAYVFELKDIPMFQSEPGKVTTVLNFVESLPVIGFAGHTDEETDTSVATGGFLANRRTESKVRGVVEAAKLGSTHAKAYLRGILARLAKGVYDGIVDRDPTAPDVTNVAIDQRSNASLIDKLVAAGMRLTRYGKGTPFADIIKEKRQVKYDPNKLFDGSAEAGIKALSIIFYNSLLGVQLGPAFQGSAVNSAITGTLKREKTLLVNHVYGSNYVASLLDTHIDTAIRSIASDFINDTASLLKVFGAASIFIPEGTDIHTFIVELSARSSSVDVITKQLYPDTVLPTYYQVLGVDPDSDIPEDLLLKWMPSIAETGKLDFRNTQDSVPSRILTDIVDPDVYFVREISFNKRVKELRLGSNELAPNGNPNLVINKPASTPKDDESRGRLIPSNTHARENITNNYINAKDSDVANSWDKIEQEIQPNVRRMLYAFPTYSIEFFLDIQHNEVDAQGVVIPGTTAHYEARLLNVLPLIDLEIYENCGDRPNIAELTFIARRAGLRNNSWLFLPPKTEQTIYNGDRLRFTNNIDIVKEHLNKHSTFQSDPMLLTSKLMLTGTRVSIKVGYGTDLNNPRMLPHKISGTISGVSLGEISQMVVQSFGTQLANSLNTGIGGSGRYSPNKVLSGYLTMRAFSDIFHALDTRFMGRTGRGIDIDARTLSTADMERIHNITLQTRTVLDEYAPAVLGFASDLLETADEASWGYLAVPIMQSLVLSGKVANYIKTKVFEDAGVSSKDFLNDVGSSYFNPYRNFYPELLNVKGPPIGISDWAISNTETMNLSAATWIDMISRLNPGTVWFPHTYGDEVRLFWGKPEAVFRADPGSLNSEESAAMLQFMRLKFHTSVGGIYKALRDRLEAERYDKWVRLRVESNTYSPAISKFQAGYLEDLFNPKGGRSLRSHTNFLLSQGLTPAAVGELIRKLMVAKTNDIQDAVTLLKDLASAPKPDGKRKNIEEVLRVGFAGDGLDTYIQKLYDNSANTVAPFVSIDRRGTSDVGLVGTGRTNAPGVNTGLENLGSRGNGIHRDALLKSVQNMRSNFGVRPLFNARFNGAANFVNTLHKLEGVAWNDINDELLDRLDISSADLEEQITKDVSVDIEFTGKSLRMLRFLLERVIEDLNYLYTVPTKNSDQELDKSMSGAVSNTAKAATKYLRTMRLNGYRKFRNSHVVISGQQLMSANLEATQAYMANAVSYDGYTVGYNVLPEERRVMDLDSEMSKLNFGVFEWFKGLIGKNERDRVIDVLFPSALAKGMSKMYQGELLLVGDPYIKPHDVIYMLDLHNGVYGPMCCETVINKLSVRNGLVTVVRPSALTQAQSSRFLTDYLVQQRQMKTLLGVGIIASAAALAIPIVGVPLAAVGGTASAVFSGIIDVADTYGRLRLENVPVTDPFMHSLLKGEGATAESVENFVNTIMVDSYVSGTGLVSTGMGQDRGELLKRIREAQSQTQAAQLGVSMIPLKRLATHTPWIAGLRTSGFDTIDIPDYSTILNDGTSRPFVTVERTVSDMVVMYDDVILNFDAGIRFISRDAKSRAEQLARLEAVFKERGIGTQ